MINFSLSMDIDDKDLQILIELRKNSSIVLKDLAEKLDSKSSTIHNRIKKLEEKGVIKGYTVKLNMKSIQYDLVGFVMLNFDKSQTDLDQERVAKKLSNMKRVEEVHLIAGEFDILLKVRAKDIDDLGEFVTKDIKEVKGVSGNRTYVSLKKLKETNDPPYVVEDLFKK